MKKRCFAINCHECGKKVQFFKAYRHPVEGKKKCVCRTCWEKVEESQREYSNFILHSVDKNNGGTACFLMINTMPRYTKKVYDDLSKLSEIIEHHPISERHNIIAKVNVKDYEKFGGFVESKIGAIEGIKNITSLTGAFSLV
ncbi:MAG: Lrp/AsnC ligand binding domain-containing protein [Thermoplasmatales archaeon]|nr:MAG: Lrp/AsnC ligand binding domain-containing protein [Thermoplasmatales archaeon]